jgi:hypothetical protein
MHTEIPKGLVLTNRFRSESNLDDSALQTDQCGVGSVVGAQFGEDVPDLALDGFFADGELRGNLLVGIPFGNQPQDTDLRRCQRVIRGMLGKLAAGLGGKTLFPGMDGTNRFQQATRTLMPRIFFATESNSSPFPDLDFKTHLLGRF